VGGGGVSVDGWKEMGEGPPNPPTKKEGGRKGAGGGGGGTKRSFVKEGVTVYKRKFSAIWEMGGVKKAGVGYRKKGKQKINRGQKKKGINRTE